MAGDGLTPGMHKKQLSALYFAAVCSLGGLLFGLDAPVISGVIGFVVQFIFPWELSNLGSAVIFFVYSALGLLAFVLPGWLLPETKGRSLEELENILTKRV